MTKTMIPMAIAYDFDGTLSPGNMQEYNFIPALNMLSHDFWHLVESLKKSDEMDSILAYMYVMLEEARKNRIAVRREDFRNFGAKIQFFEGVTTWFERMNAYAASKNIQLEHFIISSGIREMIEGTAIYPYFKKVYASGFLFDHHGIACWPAFAINYTNKTQFLFRINKGCLNPNDHHVINRFIPKAERVVPFENMVFIGDGETDIPCMRLVKNEGGYAIAVYPPQEAQTETTAKNAQLLVQEGRASLAVPADYREQSPLDLAIKAIIDRLEATARIHG